MVIPRIRLAVALGAALTAILAGTAVSPALSATAVAGAALPSAAENGHGPSQLGGRLTGISTVSPTKAWAVGVDDDGSAGILLFWNGARWQQSRLELPGRVNELTAVDARRANDIWAVGYYYPEGSSRELTLIEHWDGSSWHQERVPGRNFNLNAVSADSSNDAWAAGFGPFGGVLLHWDGDTWTSVRNKDCRVCTITGLRGVTAISPTDAWTVGYTGGGTSTFKTMHWDGVSWSVVPSAMPGGRKVEGSLEAVSATSSTDVWAVGTFITEDISFRSFIEHWDGTSWTRVPSLNRQRPDGAVLYGVAAVSPDDAWTSGYQLRPSRTVTDHWNGRRWTEVPSPDPGLLLAVDASSSSNAWVAGGRAGRTLIEHWDGHRWSVT